MSFQAQADFYNSFTSFGSSTPDTADVMQLKKESSTFSEQIRLLNFKTNELQRQIDNLEEKIRELTEENNG